MNCNIIKSNGYNYVFALFVNSNMIGLHSISIQICVCSNFSTTEG